MRHFWKILASVVLSGTFASGASAAPITVGTEDITGQNIVVPAVGSTTASNFSVGSYVVETFSNGSGVRPIFIFDVAAFASLDPNALTSASLSFNLTGSFLEADDTYPTEVRLFSTPGLIPLDSAGAASQYAALTGDGGPNTTIATISFGSTPGSRTLNFDLAALTALSTILSSGAGYIGLTIREAAYVENGTSSTGGAGNVPGLDGLVINFSSVTLTVDGAAAPVVPLPGALPLFGSVLAGAGALRLRRKRT